MEITDTVICLVFLGNSFERILKIGQYSQKL